ncbi:serine hydrolase [Cryomorphaceae bacterium 1068]|nr:serine hydrolase [Cryomorphaceae bacterium 1068]
MRKLICPIILLTCLGLSSLASSQDYDKLDSYLAAMVDQKKFVGTVLVAQGDSIVYHKGLGPASADGSKLNTTESQFLIGSITKTFTAIAIMQLFEEEKLSLSDPLSKYISLFPQSDKITIRHLLSHKSGIKNYTELPDMDQWKAKEISPLRLVEKVMDYPLGFEPGSMFSYSNTNYVLLGIIIEQVTGTTYEKYLQANILKPEGLGHTGMNYKKVKNLSEGLIVIDGEWTKADKVDPSVPFSAGALYSSTEDLFTFSKTFFSGGFYESKSASELQTNFDEGQYALGVYADEIDEQVFIGHNGGIDGYSATWNYFKDLDLHTIVLSNCMESNNNEVLDAILHAHLGEEILLPEPKMAIEMPLENLERLVGTYEIQKGFDLNIFLENGKLMGQATGQGSLELFAENDSAFFAKVAEIEVVFHQKGTEQAKALTLYQGGGSTKAPRVEKNRIAVKLEAADLLVLEGTYVLQEGFEIRVFTEGDKLMAQATGQPPFELFAENRQDFFTEGLGIEISFVFDDKGETKSLTLFQGGGKYDAEKRVL